MASNPDRLGRYDILRPLGSGGMGEVYVAHDPLLGRNVAIKILPERLAGDRDALARFTQEARSASALSHPNIVTIYEIGTDHGKPFIAMEYIDGRDLRTYINEGPQSNRLTVDVAAQIADGLAAAHEHSIIHRDLKPENVMVTKDGFVKILDFGLAKLLAEGGDELSKTVEYRVPSTMPGTILGTVGYMSPEQATGRRIDFRSDQFALGAILYELATGHAAFERENAIDVMSAILHEEPPPVRDFNMRCPPPLTWVIDRLLQKEPAGRYETTRECANELKALRDRIHAEGSALDLPKPPALTSKQRRNIGIAGGTLIAFLLFLVAVVMTRRVGPQGVAAAQQRPKSYVAVLPFSNLSGGANGQLVADGFAETVSTRLSRLPSVQLIRPPKPQDISDKDDAQKIGRELGVNMIVRGSMQQAGNRLRVSYAIIDTQNRSQLAADTVEGTATDLFDAQDKLVTKIASYLDPKAAPQSFPSLDPNVSQQRYLEALGHLRRFDKEDELNAAISILEDLGTTSATVQASLGLAYLAKFTINRDPQLIKKAREYCDAAAAADPLNPDVHVTLGQVMLRTGGDTDKAIAEFNRALQQQPNNVEAILGLANAYDARKQLAQAEAYFKKGIELQPKYWPGYNALGFFYFTHARYPAAAAEFQKALQISPDNVRAYTNLGAAYQQMGRYDDAIGMYQKTIDQKPTAQAYSNLGSCYYFLGRYKESASMFEKAVQLSPSTYRYWANLGDAYRWAIGGEANAKNAYAHAIDLERGEVQRNPKDAYIRARLAECLAKHGDLSNARGEIARALADDPANTGVMVRAAIIEAIDGHQEQAATLLKNAVEKGYSRTEVELEPEFSAARKTATFQRLPPV